MAEKRIETVEMRAGDVKTGFGNPRKITKRRKMNSETASRLSETSARSS